MVVVTPLVLHNVILILSKITTLMSVYQREKPFYGKLQNGKKVHFNLNNGIDSHGSTKDCNLVILI